MIIVVLKICCLLIALALPVFLPAKRKIGTVKFPKNYKDTSDAQYAINEHGFLERIHNDDLSSQSS
ncbi:MAG TPA: hypothetical protein VGN20_15840 [Mucilaginibacter sp.]|jgi:hypothetical protein